MKYKLLRKLVINEASYLYESNGMNGGYGEFTMSQIFESENKEEIYVKFDGQIDLSKDKRFEEVTQSYVEKMLGW